MRKIIRLAASLMLLAAGTAEAAPAPLFATLRVTVQGVTGKGGTLIVGVYDEATFPSVPDAPLFKREIAKVAGDAAVIFDRLPPGSYALKALQDVNGNGRAEAGEPQGISNGANPADFDAAAIVLEPGPNMALVRLK